MLHLCRRGSKVPVGHRNCAKPHRTRYTCSVFRQRSASYCCSRRSSRRGTLCISVVGLAATKNEKNVHVCLNIRRARGAVSRLERFEMISHLLPLVYPLLSPSNARGKVRRSGIERDQSCCVAGTNRRSRRKCFPRTGHATRRLALKKSNLLHDSGDGSYLQYVQS